MQYPTGLGLNSWTQQIQNAGQSTTNYYSMYNNGFTRTSFKVTSSLPVNYSTTNTQAREFNNQNFIPVIQYMGSRGVVDVPDSLKWTSPDGIPTWNELNNWCGPSQQQQQGGYGLAPQGGYTVPPQVSYPPVQSPVNQYPSIPPMQQYPAPGGQYGQYPINAGNAAPSGATSAAGGQKNMIAALALLLAEKSKSKKSSGSGGGGGDDEPVLNKNAIVEGNGETVNLNDEDGRVYSVGDNNTINANGGKDNISNFGNSNTINAGTGDDIVSNTGDSNVIDGGEGADIIQSADADKNTLKGGAGDDTIVSTAGNQNVIEGGEGNDDLTSIDGNQNTLRGGTGNDKITADGGTKNVLEGQDGADDISLKNNTESSVSAGAGNDKITDNGGTKNVLGGGDGNDSFVLTNIHNNTINAGTGNDTVSVTVASNAGVGGNAGSLNNVINTEDGNDSISLNGTQGTRVNAGNGDDTVTLNTNNKDVTVSGGAGNDTVRFNGSAGDYTQVVSDDGSRVFTHITNHNVFNIANDVEKIEFLSTGGNTQIIVTDKGNNMTINGTSGDNTLTNGGNNNTVNGGAGNDTLNNIGNNSVINGGDGDDTINQQGGTGNTVNGGTGNDTLNIRNTQNSVINGNDGNDTFNVQGTDNNNVTLNGGAGTDTAIIEGARSQYTITFDDQGRRVYTCNTSDKKLTIANDIENVRFTVQEDAIVGVNANKGGNITGDPHFRDMSNSSSAGAHNFDIMGADGKTYNLLSDQNIQMNGKFKTWSQEGITVVETLGFTIQSAEGVKQVEADDDGTIKVNGQAMTNGQQINMTFFDQNGNPVTGFIKKVGNQLQLQTNEYTFRADLNGNHINTYVDVKGNGNMTDFVASHGLLGQSADGDGIITTGRTGKNAQGEGAIDGVFTDYEVNGLFGTNDKYSRFGDNITYVKDTNDVDGDGNKTEAKAIKVGNVYTSIFDTVINKWRSVSQNAQGQYVVDVDNNNDGIADKDAQGNTIKRVVDMSKY